MIRFTLIFFSILNSFTLLTQYRNVALNLGADFNISQGFAGQSAQIYIPTNSKLSLGLNYSRFSNSKVREHYYGFSTLVRLVDNKKFEFAPGISIDYNRWNNFFIYHNNLATGNTYLANFLISSAFEHRFLRLSSVALYNFIWNEYRLKLMIGLKIKPIRKKK